MIPRPIQYMMGALLAGFVGGGVVATIYYGLIGLLVWVLVWVLMVTFIFKSSGPRDSGLKDVL